MKIKVVALYELRNSTEIKKTDSRNRAIEAFLYRKPLPTIAERAAKYWDNNKYMWKWRLLSPYYTVKYALKHVVMRVKKLFAISSGPTFSVTKYTTPSVTPYKKSDIRSKAIEAFNRI